MNTTYFFRFILLPSLLIFIGCSSNSEEEENIEATRITLSVSDTSKLYVGDTISFTVIGNNNQNVTGSSAIMINGNVIDGNTYETSAPGTLQLSATYNNLTSDALEIEVLPVSASKFTKNVLIEDYTGTWCGFCPRVSYALELVKQETDNAVIVAIHRGDSFNFQANTLENMINLQGYPTAMLDRTTNWQGPEPNNVSQVVGLANADSAMGIALSPTLTGSSISINVDVKFGDIDNLTNLKLVVYLLEDDLIKDQENYTSYYGGQSVIKDFEHDHVLRAAFTNLLGDQISSDQIVAENIYSRTLTATIPGNVVDASKLSVVAVVTNGNTNKALNSRLVYFGETQTFQVQ